MIGEVSWHESITCILDLPERFSIIIMFAYTQAFDRCDDTAGK